MENDNQLTTEEAETLRQDDLQRERRLVKAGYNYRQGTKHAQREAHWGNRGEPYHPPVPPAVRLTLEPMQAS
eukprot:5119641-Pyramimonas_sp.AAC.1